MSNKSKWIKAIGVKLKKRSVKHLPGETKMKRRSPNKALSLFLLEETNGIAD